MTDTPRHSVSVAGVVVDDQGRVLVIQRRDNAHWEPPGGVLELDETPEDGVRREVFEETGVLVVVEGLSGVYKNMKRGILALVFKCRQVGGQPTLTSESIAVSWRSVDDVVNDMDPAFSVRITDALQDEISIRAHDGINLLERDFQ